MGQSCEIAPNKLRLLRSHEIDRLVRAGGYPSTRALAAALEVHARTIQRDIEFMRDSFGAPLAYDAGRRGYHYTEPSFALPALELREAELEALDAARRYFGRLVATSLGEDVESLFKKLASWSPGHDRPRRPVPRLLESPQATTATEVYATLRGAIRRGRRARIWHEGQAGAVRERELEPYDLTFFDGAWYVVGHCCLRQAIRIFALARISRAQETLDTFTQPPGYDLEQYLADAFSFFRAPEGAASLPVVLLFEGYAARYVGERHWHRSQRLERLADGRVRLSLELPLSPALETWVLEWADQVVVESPAELAQRVIARHRRAIEVQERASGARR